MKKLYPFKYLLVYITPILVYFSIYNGKIWSYTPIVIFYILIPILELFTNGNNQNLTSTEEDEIKNNKIFDFILYTLVLMQYGLLFYFLFHINDSTLVLYEKIGMTISFGISCGILGINAAHELGHRNTWYEQFMSKILLLSTLYMHFFIEHNRGHHKNVSTDLDPASSRYGENVYSFYLRSIYGSWFSAWHLERERLALEKKPFWSYHNEMLRFQLIQIILIIAIYMFFNLSTLLYFIFAAIIGILMLETVNYIEHYGLRRKIKNARFERTLPIHSWNSNHPIGRLLLLELSRHSDHHFIATRKYQILKHHDESPQMPTGYPGMMILSLIPPLWFFIMHKQIKKYQQ